MSSRILLMITATLAVVFVFVGCSSTEPQFDPATKYSPASLAQELSFRYQSLDRNRPDERPDGVVTKAGAVTKAGGGAATKAARVNSLDTLLSDAIEKASAIPGLSRAEACKKVAEEIARTSSIPEADRKIIAERLEQASAGQ